jgi:hypothetical protein
VRPSPVSPSHGVHTALDLQPVHSLLLYVCIAAGFCKLMHLNTFAIHVRIIHDILGCHRLALRFLQHFCPGESLNKLNLTVQRKRSDGKSGITGQHSNTRYNDTHHRHATYRGSQHATIHSHSSLMISALKLQGKDDIVKVQIRIQSWTIND